jgi:hypothetical protein
MYLSPLSSSKKIDSARSLSGLFFWGIVLRRLIAINSGPKAMDFDHIAFDRALAMLQ